MKITEFQTELDYLITKGKDGGLKAEDIRSALEDAASDIEEEEEEEEEKDE